MAYTEAPDAEVQLKRFLEDCAQHDIPATLFHLSSGYTTDAEGRRNVFTWNESKCPDPRGLVRAFADAGIPLAPNVKPHLLESHPGFKPALVRGCLHPARALFWAGGAGSSAHGRYVNFASKEGALFWRLRLKASLLDLGVEAVWNDNNEFTELPCRERPAQIMGMARASFTALLEKQPHRRPLLLTRAGTVGVQSLAQTWTGDNASSFHSLRWGIPVGLGLSLSAVPHFGHDVGGFAGPAPSPELLCRWVACGAFLPRFCIHSWNTDGTVTSPWLYERCLPLTRHFIHLRRALLPTLYALTHHAAASGDPLNRPLMYEFPADGRASEDSFRFLLGAGVLLSPVLDEACAELSVYLPRGCAWLPLPLMFAPEHRIPAPALEGGTELAYDVSDWGACIAHLREGHVLALEDPAAPGTRFVVAHPASAARRSLTAATTLVEDDGCTRVEADEYRALRITVSAGPAEDRDAVLLSAHVEAAPQGPPDAHAQPVSLTWLLPLGETRPVATSPGMVVIAEGSDPRLVHPLLRGAPGAPCPFRVVLTTLPPRPVHH